MWDCMACIYFVIDFLNDLWDLWILHQSIHILLLILRMIWHYWRAMRGEREWGWEGTSLFFLFAKNALVLVGLSNRYQRKPKAPVEKPGVLRRDHWSRLRGTGWETGAFGPSQPVPKARFLVVP